MKQSKKELQRDSVSSDTIHIGIELELVKSCEGTGHDDDACHEARYESEESYLNDMSDHELIETCLGVSVSRSDASSLSSYLDTRQMISDYMSNWDDNGCDDEENCGYAGTESANKVRSNLCRDLKVLTGNESFKVVQDGSINHDSGACDSEVCWNYFISKDTVKDNEKIMRHLVDSGCEFNSSCGLHININNYKNVNLLKDASGSVISMPMSELQFLFNFVGTSRRTNSYCNRNGMADEKYSMIYNQGDRLEFRFFSPTLDAEKLNHYVRLAHHVYKRLAGDQCKLPKKTEEYFLDKMTKTNGHSVDTAKRSILLVNEIHSYKDYFDSVAEIESVEESDDTVQNRLSAPFLTYPVPESVSQEVQL